MCCGRGGASHHLALPLPVRWIEQPSGEHMVDWQDLIPATRGTLPGGAPLRRTDPSGEGRAKIAFLGVYPAATKVRQMSVDGTRMNLPVEVEAESFAPGSASGKEFEDHYLKALKIKRADVMVTDMLPYYLSNTTLSKGSKRSMADNVRAFEEAKKISTGIEARPKEAALVKLARKMPGNIARLTEYFERVRPRLLFTLGTESAAFVRGLEFAEADSDVLFYQDAEEIQFLGLSMKVVHMVHPHLFIKMNEKWTSRHANWLAQTGRAVVKA